METLVMVCAAIVLQCGPVQLENTTISRYPRPFNDRDFFTMLIAKRKCEFTCPKKCLTKFTKTGKNSYWAICGGK